MIILKALTHYRIEPVDRVPRAVFVVDELVLGVEVVGLAPLLLDDIPDPLDGVEHGAVGRQEHEAEAGVIKLHDGAGSMNREVVLHDYCWVISALKL